jgi:hypothetical protein
MSQTQYCAQHDAYRFAAPGMLQVPARSVAAVSTSTWLFTLAGHGFATDDEVAFRAEAGGSLPTGLTAGVTCFAIYVSPDTFQVAASAGGAAIHVSTTGSNVLAVAHIPWSRFIDECSAMTEQTIVAHKVPLLNDDGTVPEPVRAFTAAQLAMRVLAFCGRETQAVEGQLKYWGALAEKWGRGVPLRGVARPPAVNVAISRSGARVDPLGWDRGDGRFP